MLKELKSNWSGASCSQLVFTTLTCGNATNGIPHPRPAVCTVETVKAPGCAQARQPGRAAPPRPLPEP